MKYGLLERLDEENENYLKDLKPDFLVKTLASGNGYMPLVEEEGKYNEIIRQVERKINGKIQILDLTRFINDKLEQAKLYKPVITYENIEVGKEYKFLYTPYVHKSFYGLRVLIDKVENQEVIGIIQEGNLKGKRYPLFPSMLTYLTN